MLFHLTSSLSLHLSHFISLTSSLQLTPPDSIWLNQMQNFGTIRKFFSIRSPRSRLGSCAFQQQYIFLLFLHDFCMFLYFRVYWAVGSLVRTSLYLTLFDKQFTHRQRLCLDLGKRLRSMFSVRSGPPDSYPEMLENSLTFDSWSEHTLPPGKTPWDSVRHSYVWQMQRRECKG